MSRAPLTRRDFIARAAALGSVSGALAAPCTARAVASALNAAKARSGEASSREVASGAVVPVVSFHLDRPYVDFSGEAIPYLPPAGARGLAALGGLSEADLFLLPL